MMKAQLRHSEDKIILQVCGRLAEGWVTELARCWHNARTSYTGIHICVDLRGVTFIDQAGERLLETMHREGASFLTAGLLIQEVVNQVTSGLK